MAILDIRKEQTEEITGIKFDNSSDFLAWDRDYLLLKNTTFACEIKTLCELSTIDDFIAALHKAKELAGK